MEVSSSSWSTQTQQCYNCVSSWYSTFFNIALLQFLSGGGPQVAFHRGVLLGSAALRLLAFPFTSDTSYSHHLLAVCHCSLSYRAVTTRTTTELQAYCSQCCFAAREMALKGRKQPAPSSSTAAPLGTAPSHPELLSHQRHRGCLVQRHRQGGGKKQSPKGHTKHVPHRLALF